MLKAKVPVDEADLSYGVWVRVLVDRRVEARSEQSGARAWCLESPLRELRKGGLERERPNTRERNTANPYRLHDLETNYWHYRPVMGRDDALVTSSYAVPVPAPRAGVLVDVARPLGLQR